ncbi:MAG: hypothetical protein IID34_00190 [Planctomycetes bacterium]|nr:hypothetical protein [Planctomycetota bacterium]
MSTVIATGIAPSASLWSVGDSPAEDQSACGGRDAGRYRAGNAIEHVGVS